MIGQHDGVETHDDGPLLLAAFDRAALVGEVLPWGPSRDWSAYDLVVVRNAWDYVDRLEEFLAWAATVEGATTLANPSAVLRWNTDKRYLRDLAGEGVPTVPTIWIDATDGGQPMADVPWQEIVVKPAVSAGSRATARYGPGDADRARAEAHVRALVDQGLTVLVQPYLPDVDARGEAGTYVFGGAPSHAIRKSAVLVPGAPAPTDFSLAHGQVAVPIPVTAELAAFAADVLDRVRSRFGDLLYARVDAVRDDQGHLALLELELIEPFLYLVTDPAAADRFASAVVSALAPGDAGRPTLR